MATIGNQPNAGRRAAPLALAAAASLGPAAGAAAQCQPTPGAWVPNIGGVNNIVLALATLPPAAGSLAGHVIVGGGFTMAGGAPASYLARYNPSDHTWSALAGGVNGPVSCLAVMPGGDVIVGGNFSMAGGAGGVPAAYIARFGTASGTWSPLGSGVDGPVNALLLLPGGDLIAGGDFDQAGAVTVNGIARFSSGDWTPLGGGVTSGTVQALAVLGGGDIVAGGTFPSMVGAPGAGYIARYNPATSAWSALGSGVNSAVNSLAVIPGGDLFAGGYFTAAGGHFSVGIARYSPSSNTWAPAGPGPGQGGLSIGYVNAMRVLPGGDVVLGGGFGASAWGVPSSNIARYNPATHAWSALGAGTNHVVYALTTLAPTASTPEGEIVAGGLFNQAGGAPAQAVGRYAFGSSGVPACYGNCDCSTAAPTLNVADFTCFLQRFAAGASYANCDNSTTAPTLNVADFTCFLQQFAAGCP